MEGGRERECGVMQCVQGTAESFLLLLFFLGGFACDKTSLKKSACVSCISRRSSRGQGRGVTEHVCAGC